MKGDRIITPFRRWRAEQGLTLEEVADLTGVSVPMLSRVERGEREMAPMTRVRIARLLGVRLGSLFPPPGRRGAAAGP